MRHHFHAEQWLPYPLETVFAFFADPANLPRLMPSWQSARIDKSTLIAPPPPVVAFPGSDRISAGSGSTIAITIRPFPGSPFRASWVAVIEDFRWLHGFCDVQAKGPFAYWRHCHTVTSEPRNGQPGGQPGTLLRDNVEYTPPFGPLGTLANALFIRRQLAATFRFRQRRTVELLANPV